MRIALYMISKVIPLCVSTITMWLIVPMSILAQDRTTKVTDKNSVERELEIITITARRVEESVQKAPISVSVIGEQELERAGLDSFDMVLSKVPNASRSGGIGGSLQGLISIRGISTLVRTVGIETGVGMYVDGVYIGRPENFNFDLIDINRIEVLRGPQGAVFGKNTIAGAINIITNVPEDDFEAEISAQYGNYNNIRLRGKLSGAVGSNLSASAVVNYHHRDGYVDNAFADAPDLDNANLTSTRGKVRYQPSNNIDVVLTADLLKEQSNPSFFEVSDVEFITDPSEETPFTVNSDQPNFLNRDIWGLSISTSVNFENAKWTTLLSNRGTAFDAGLDEDKLPVRYFDENYSSNTKFSSIETRYQASLNQYIDYNIGLYYFNQNAQNNFYFALGDFLTGIPGLEPPITLTSSVETNSLAVFFNTMSSLTTKLSLEVGGRYVSEYKDAIHIQNDQTGIFGTTDFQLSRTDTDFSPIISISYLTNNDAIIFGRYAEGFKSAGFNTDFVSKGANLEVEPEQAKSIEAGVKLSSFNGMMDSYLSIFHTRYNNLQLSQVAGSAVSLNNAAKAEISGLEVDFKALLGDYFDVFGSIGYLDANYKDFPGCPSAESNPSTAQSNCAGKYLNLAPKWTMSLGLQFIYPLKNSTIEYITRLDWNYRSKVFFDPQNEKRLSGKSHQLSNFRLGLVDEQWELFLWFNNVFNKEYVNFSDDRSAIFIYTTKAYGPPRTYGITFKYKF